MNDWKTEFRTWARLLGFYGRIIDDAIYEGETYGDDAPLTYAKDWIYREQDQEKSEAANEDSHTARYGY